MSTEDGDDEQSPDENLPILQTMSHLLLLCPANVAYNLLTDFHLIGLGYKFLLTLSVTQVACERSFSTPKFIKNRLRSTVEEHLEAFMLMAIEKETLVSLDTDCIIEREQRADAMAADLIR